MGRKKRLRKALGRGADSEHTLATANVEARLEPFVCAHCGAPQPVGEGDAVTCRGCGKESELPEAYRNLREAHRLSASDAAQLDALCKDISRPPAMWERVAMVIGYAIGGITLVVMAVGAIVGLVGGFVVADKLGGGDTVAKIVIGIGVVVCGFLSVPFVGEYVIAFVTTQLDSAAATDALGGARMLWRSDLAVAGVLYFLGVVPVALAWRTSQSISHLQELQSKLAAQPPASPDGVSRCRSCGAPLDARPGALATRCIYCDAENLLTVPDAYAAKKNEDARAIDVQVQAAIAKRDATRAEDRATMWTMLGAGLLLAPLVLAGGWLLHAILSP